MHIWLTLMKILLFWLRTTVRPSSTTLTLTPSPLTFWTTTTGSELRRHSNLILLISLNTSDLNQWKTSLANSSQLNLNLQCLMRKDEFVLLLIRPKGRDAFALQRANQTTFSLRCRVENHFVVKNLTGTFRAEE